MTETTYKMARDGTQPDMKTFYQQSGPVTPYATTTLLQAQAQNARKQVGSHRNRENWWVVIEIEKTGG